MRTFTDIQLLTEEKLLRVRHLTSKKSNVRFSADFTKALTLGFASKVFPPPWSQSDTPSRLEAPPGAAPNPHLLLLSVFSARRASDGGYALSCTYTNKPPVPETHFLQVPSTFTEAHKISVQDVLLLRCN